MPTTRNALFRYLVLDECLQNRRGFTWKELLEKVNERLQAEGMPTVSRSTLYSDLHDIQFKVYKAELDEDRGHVGRAKFLKYKDPNFSITQHSLHHDEIEQLKSAIQVLSRFKGLPHFNWINELIPIIESKMQPDSSQEIISFESNDDYEGLHFLSPLFNAITSKRALAITYQSFKKETPEKLNFSPHYLKQFNSRWYIFGNNPDFPKPFQNLALDRIKAIENTDHRFTECKINWEEHFADFIGVTQESGKPVTIRILIKDREQARYIATKPLHQTQKQIKETTFGFETSIQVIPNFELEKLLLSFGEKIEVLEPIEIRDKMAAHFKLAYANYFPH